MNETNFHDKNCAPSLAVIMRFKAARKWSIALRTLIVLADGGNKLHCAGEPTVLEDGGNYKEIETVLGESE